METNRRTCFAVTQDGGRWSVEMYEADAPRLVAPVEVTLVAGVEMKEAAAALRRLAEEMERGATSRDLRPSRGSAALDGEARLLRVVCKEPEAAPVVQHLRVVQVDPTHPPITQKFTTITVVDGTKLSPEEKATQARAEMEQLRDVTKNRRLKRAIERTLNTSETEEE